MFSQNPRPNMGRHHKHNRALKTWTNISSTFATLMFVWSILRQYAPYELRRYFFSYTYQLLGVISPYIHLSIEELSNTRLTRDKTFTCVQAYLGENGSKDAKRLRLLTSGEGTRMLSMDEFEEVIDKFKGVTVWWAMEKIVPDDKSFGGPLRSYKLTFHRKHKTLVVGEYLDHVINEGKRIREKNRPRRLYFNSLKEYYCGWTYVAFDHPASFDSLAMEPEKKKEIVDDLLNFSKSKDHYLRIGKAWKRGYLLYGPPGTGKTTLIAAMANLLNYDVYDLELTAVTDNTKLKKLLINTNNKSIIVIEDIDCSVNLTGKRDENGKLTNQDVKRKDTQSFENGKLTNQDVKRKDTQSFTLSGLLNFIDGIWSSCGGERIIIFTTNYVKKLDPALIRAGRMDKHIELSYCGYEGFKVLAKNYLLVEAHPIFDVIKGLLEEVKMTPADVAENLMPKFPNEEAESCLENLIRALQKVKSDAAKRKELKTKMKKDEHLAKTEEPKEETKQEEGQNKTEEIEIEELEELKEENVDKKQGL